MATSGSGAPRGFSFFAGLTLFLGILGVVGNALFLGLSVSHGLPAHLKAVSPSVWLSVLHLFRDAGYIVGGIKMKKHLEWARLLIVVCAALSLCELFYNTAMSLSKGQLSASATNMLFFLLPLLMEGSVLVYFSTKGVRDFLRTRQAI